MKKITVLIVLLFTCSMLVPVAADSAAPGDLCDPKKLEECQQKIDSLLSSVEKLRTELLATKSDLQGGKKLTNEQADKLMQKLDAIQKVLQEGNIRDY